MGGRGQEKGRGRVRHGAHESKGGQLKRKKKKKTQKQKSRGGLKISPELEGGEEWASFQVEREAGGTTD